MNATETVQLIAVIKALCPNQKFEDMTHRAWSMVMSDITFNDAQTAVQTIYREQGTDAQWSRSIEADDIIRQVKRDRGLARPGGTCKVCGLIEKQCRRAQENQFRIADAVHQRHPERAWDMAQVESTRHEFTPSGT